MEDAVTLAAPRGLIRRSLPWALSLALFAGGGYGVYAYALPKPGEPSTVENAAAAPQTDPKPIAVSSSAAKDQFKQLFAATPAEPVDSEDNRYAQAAGNFENAPQLPPAQPAEAEAVETPRSAASLAPQQNPFAAQPVGGLANRYSSSAPASPSSVPASNQGAPGTSEPPTVVIPPAAKVDTPAGSGRSPVQPEVTRGQEPTAENPLRSAGARPAPPSDAPPQADDARAAFSEQSSAGQPATVGSAPATQSPTEAEPAPARPLAMSAAAGDLADRYGATRASASPTPTESAIAKLTPHDAAAFTSAAQAKPLPIQQPPTFAAEVQPPPQSLTADAADTNVTPTPGLAAVDGAGRPGERILEGLQNPAVSIQKLAPAEIQVGKKCTFAVRVQNNSQRTAHDVQVRDEVPLGTQLVGTAPKATVSGAQVLWDLGTLSPGEQRVVEMELMPTAEGELGSVATVSFAAQASAKVRCTKPELALRLTAGPRVMIGQQHLVEIEVTNPGSGDATGVMLLESVPAGVSHEAGPALEFVVGTLHPGETRRLDLVLSAEQAGRVNNVMVARADANLEVQAACEFEVIAPDLKVAIKGPERRFLERPATFQMNISNPGTASAKEVQLVTQLPKGLQFVSADNYGEYDPATHSVRWSLAELPANEHGAVELTVLPVEPGELPLQVATRANQGLEDRTETKVVVEGLVALAFEIKAADGAIEVGGETSYDVTVVNQGSKVAANVQVAAVVPPGLRVTNGQGASRFTVQGDRLVFAPVAQLAPKAEAKFRIQVQGLRAGDHRTKVLVTADEVQDPITKEQGTLVYADQ